MSSHTLATRLLLSLAAATLFCAPVHADGHIGQWYVTPMVSFVDDASKRGVDDDHAGFQLGFGREISENWMVEFNLFGANLDDRYLRNNQQLRGAGVDWMRFLRNDSWLTPYGLIGLGYQSTDAGSAGSSEDMFGSLGLGVMARFADDGIGLRAEARMRSLSSTPHLNDMYYGIGLQIPLGEHEPPPPPDSDGDGVPNADDRCPNTPAGARVGPDGCEVDSDRDGVVDSKDKCPNTPRGARVDAKGCPIDSDGDGVPNSKDRCPNTTAGARVDVNGCEIKETIKLPGIQFELNAATLRPESTRILDDAAKTLAVHEDLVVEVAGHTDSSGAASYNESLSSKRAAAVARYLESKGVAAERLKSKGYGESEPIADNSTEQGRRQNRRVELKILSRDF